VFSFDEDVLKKTPLRLFGFDGHTSLKLADQSEDDGQKTEEEGAEDHEYE
jgi:hypothetical protein